MITVIMGREDREALTNRLSITWNKTDREQFAVSKYCDGRGTFLLKN